LEVRTTKRHSRSCTVAAQAAQLHMVLGLGGNQLSSVHVGAKRGGNDYAAVFLLVILQDRDERAADGESRSVEGVDELRLACSARAELDVRATSLERFGVAAG